MSFITEPTVTVIVRTALIAQGGKLNPKARDDQDQGTDGERLIEFAGRECYDSYGKGRSSEEYHKHILDVDHGSVEEHVNLTFHISGVSRALTHELVRHRVGTAISQRSTRYVDESDCNFVIPPAIAEAEKLGFTRTEMTQLGRHVAACLDMHEHYDAIVGILSRRLPRKQAREAARNVLPMAAETSLVWTVNIRALRHCISKRATLGADWEICRLFVAIWRAAQPYCPAYLNYEVCVEEGTGREYLVEAINA